MGDATTPRQFRDSTPPPEQRREATSTQRGGTVSSNGGKMNVDVFDGRSDYKFWERRMKSVLRAMGLGNALRMDKNTTPPTVWINTQEQAIGMVHQYLSPSVFKVLKEEDSVQRLFDELHDRYHHEDLPRRLVAMLQLMNFKMKSTTTPMRDHIDEYEDLVRDLENMGESIENERKALQLLISLPLSYQSLSRVILNKSKNEFTYENVVNALLTDELQNQLMSTKSSSDQAMQVGKKKERGRKATREEDTKGNKSKSRSKTPNKMVTCWICGKEGHVKKECPDKEKKKKEKAEASKKKEEKKTSSTSHVKLIELGSDDDLLDDGL